MAGKKVDDFCDKSKRKCIFTLKYRCYGCCDKKYPYITIIYHHHFCHGTIMYSLRR